MENLIRARVRRLREPTPDLPQSLQSFLVQLVSLPRTHNGIRTESSATMVRYLLPKLDSVLICATAWTRGALEEPLPS